jgi:hypothetical protein
MAKNSVVETSVSTEEDTKGMEVVKLEAPDRLKQLREAQRAMRLEAKQLKDALKQQAENEKAAKLSAMTPEERVQFELIKAASEVIKFVKKNDFAGAYKASTNLRKKIEHAQAEAKTAE